MRRPLALTMLMFCAAGLAAAFAAPTDGRDMVLFNHSPSLPVGLYMRVSAPVTPGAIVTVRAASVAPALAAARGFDGPRDRFIKRAAAVGAGELCRVGERVTIDGNLVATIPARQLLRTQWDGCRRLGPEEVLLLGETPDSFDGRYWGPVTLDLVEGVWRKL